MISLPEYVQKFLDVFKTNNYVIYVVGGPVRDLLLQKDVTNWDFTTNATPEQILFLFPDGFYNNTFGTVGIEIKENDTSYIFEVTTFRKEGIYRNNRHPDTIEWAQTIEEDLARRDFTINAMAFDGKTLLDPYDGQGDLQKKIIKAVGEPDVRFQEDALRLMRAVRIATILGFSIEEKTKEAIISNASRISSISYERIRDEFFKILASPNAAEGVLLLKDVGLLQYILPEIDQSFATQQKSPQRHHIYDVGTHLVESLRHCPSSNVITRFATLLHDIGKPHTYRKDPETEIITFYNHEVVGTNMAEKIADRFRLSNKDKEKLLTLIRNHQFTVSEDQTDKAVRRFIRQVGKENIQDMLDLRLADRLGSGAKPTSWRFDLFKKRLIEVQQEPFNINDLKIDGTDVMNELSLKPGPKIGEILQKLFDEVENKTVSNDREELLKKIHSLN